MTPPAATPPAPQAPAPEHAPDWGQSRTLGKHTFPFAVFVPTSFTTTTFGLRAGVNVHSVPDYPSARGPLDLQEIGVTEGMDLGVRLHDRVALYGDGYGSARVGSNIDTLLGSGGQYEYGGNVGALVKILRFDSTNTQISARAGFGMYGGQQIGVGSFASSLRRTVNGTVNAVKKDIQARNQTTPAQVIADLDKAVGILGNLFDNADDLLLTPFSGKRAQLNVAAAQAAGRYVGVQASLGLGLAWATATPTRFRGTQPSQKIDVSQTIVTPGLGLAADFDASSLGVPLDLVLEYNPSFPRTRTVSKVGGQEAKRSASRTQHLLGTGLYYSGRRDLQLGVLGYAVVGQEPLTAPKQNQNAPQNADDTTTEDAESGPPTDFGGQFVFRYIW